MTVLSDDQLARLEKEMAEFVVPPASSEEEEDEDDTAAGDGTDVSSSSSSSSSTSKRFLDDEERSRIESHLLQISDLGDTLNNDLLPQVRTSRTKLRSDVDGIRGDIRGGRKRKKLASSPDKLLERTQNYETVLAGLREIIGSGKEDARKTGLGSRSTSYRDWDDDRLKTTFVSLMAQLEQLALDVADGEDDGTTDTSAEGGGRSSSANRVLDNDAIVADLGSAIRAALGDDTSSTTTHDGDDSTRPNKAVASVRVCDPAFLSREVPAGCLNDDGAGSGGSGGDDCSAAAEAASAVDTDDVARESDLFAFVGLIEGKLRDRTGRFSGIASSTDVEEGSVCPLTDTSAQHRLATVVNRKVAEANAKIKREKGAVAAASTENEKEIEELPEDDEEEKDKICATEDDVEYLLDEGLDAIHRKRDLREELLSALRLLYDDKGEEFDSESIEWNALDASRKEQGPKSTPHPDWIHAADASFAHRGSFRTLIDTPSFHESVNKLDALADAVGGYNDGIDRLVDSIAGDERDGGSVSKTVKTAILNVAGRIPIPPQYYKWKEKAGVLA